MAGPFARGLFCRAALASADRIRYISIVVLLIKLVRIDFDYNKETLRSVESHASGRRLYPPTIAFPLRSARRR